MSNREIGYDTFGPQYPPEWDKIIYDRCDHCGRMVNEDEITMYDNNQFCEECWEMIEKWINVVTPNRCL